MALITLVGKRIAKVGASFVYAGPLPDCRECKTKQVCFNLVPGKAYVITAIREKAHDCKMTGGEVVIAELEEAPQEFVVPKRQAIEGSTITFKAPRCKRPSCLSYRKCHPTVLADGTKLKILKSKGAVVCEKGEAMVLVESK